MGRVRHRIAQLRRDWDRGGWIGIGRRLLGSVHLGSFHVVVLACRNPRLPAATDTARDGFLLERVGTDRVQDLAACAGHNRRRRARLAELYRTFFAAGARCFVARLDDRMIGHLWAFSGEYTITVDDYRHTRLGLALDDGSVFTGNAHVTREFRNSGVFRQLKAFAVRDYPPGTRFYTWVDRMNDASLAVNRTMGYQPIARIRWTGRGARWNLALCPTGAASWTRLGRAPWPRLRLAADRLLIDRG